MKHYQRIVSCGIALLVALPAMAAPARQPITSFQIAAAMNRFGIPVAPEQVEFLSNVVASTRDPELRVESIQRWGGQAMRVRLSCADPGQCVPFFVGLHLEQARPAAPGTVPVSLVQTSVPASSGAGGADPAVTRIPAVRAGMPATLFLDGDHVHIRLTVICLQNGTPGQTIRATDKDRRMVYTAQVADAGLLKGRL